MSVSDNKYKENLKDAAEFLLKGGTLLSEPCEKCSGIQVRKNNETKCIICGNKTSTETQEPEKDLSSSEQLIYKDNINVKKDGSLSVWSGENGKRYINIEKEHGKVKQSVEMLEKLLDVLAEKELTLVDVSEK